MWHPAGHVSWNHAVNILLNSAEEVLALASLGGRPNSTVNGKPGLVHTAAFYLHRRDFADDWEEGELIVWLTTVVLLVNLFEEFPPVATNLDGNKIVLDPTFLWHKDQIEYCYFSWPLKDNQSFKPFFEYAKHGRFNWEDLMERFAFIDPETGGIKAKNGTEDFLVNGLSLSRERAREFIEMSRRLTGFVLSWECFPEGQDLRKLFSCIEANDVFTEILDRMFGPLSESLPRDEEARKVGRPRQRDELAQIYTTLFPNGHEEAGLTLKEVARQIEAKSGRRVTSVTLSRGLQDLRQKQNQK